MPADSDGMAPLQSCFWCSHPLHSLLMLLEDALLAASSTFAKAKSDRGFVLVNFGKIKSFSCTEQEAGRVKRALLDPALSKARPLR